MKQQQRAANSYDYLKIIAVVTMIIDHYGAYINDNLWYRVIGRMAFPLFLFLVGYSENTKIKPRLIIAAGIVLIIDYWHQQQFTALNILLCIALTRWFRRKKQNSNYLGIEIGILLWFWIPTRFIFQYGTLNLLMADLGHKAKNKKQPLLMSLALFTFYGITQAWLLHFNFYQMSLLFVLLTTLALYLPSFTIKPKSIPKSILLISHYALEIYVIHLFIFKIALS